MNLYFFTFSEDKFGGYRKKNKKKKRGKVTEDNQHSSGGESDGQGLANGQASGVPTSLDKSVAKNESVKTAPQVLLK